MTVEHQLVEREWDWPNKRSVLDATLLDKTSRVELSKLATTHGYLDRLPARVYLSPLDFTRQMDDVAVNALANLQEVWMRSTQPDLDRVIAFAWHTWYERVPRWESFLPPKLPWEHNWQRKHEAMGRLVYNTWVSIYELEKYWLNWLIRANGWINRQSMLLGLTLPACDDKDKFNKFINGIYKPLSWYERDGLRMEEVITGQPLPGLDWFFSRDELLMRFDESAAMIEACRAFRVQAKSRAERKICNKLQTKLESMNKHFWTSSYGFIQAEMGNYGL